MTRAEQFPWRVFWKFFVWQWISLNALLFAVVGILDLKYSLRDFVSNDLFLNFALFSILVCLATSYSFTLPIHKVMLKALKVSNKRIYGKLVDEENEGGLLEDPVGAFSDIEIILDKIHRKMKHRKYRLLRVQEESRAYLSSVAEGVVRVSLDEKIIFHNDQFATQFLEPEHLALFELPLKQAIRNVEILKGFEIAIKTGRPQQFTVRLLTLKDSLPRFFSVSITPVKNETSGEMYEVIGVFHDISELKRAEQIRIDFVANASHELRTPLTSIKGYLDTLTEDMRVGNLAESEKFLSIISTNVDRLMELVNDMLSINSLEHAHNDLNQEMVDPFIVTEQVVSELIVLAQNKKILIHVNVDAPSFIADSRKVEQVLRNLVSNAVKYIPEGKVINIKWEKDIKDFVILRVIDNGPGIPEQHLDRLFERFYRVDKGRTRDRGGTGLGLAIVKHIMQSHGGTVAAKSLLNEGCEFICSFPIRK